MPDRRHHRGSHPEDPDHFAPEQLVALCSSVSDISWMLSHDYAPDASLKLVGDHFGLTVRQRMAVRRCACSDESLSNRTRKCITLGQHLGQPLGVDGYNLLITIESALSGGLVLIGRDRCYRDLASVHGTYRIVEETLPALATIVSFLGEFDISCVDWYLDKPVSNSGRLKVLMAEFLETRPDGAASRTRWNIELVDSPDRVLSAYTHSVATADSIILDRCHCWVNLAASIVAERIAGSWIVDLGGEARPD